MGRYFFDIYDGNKLVRDPEGHECSDMNDVQLEAMLVLPELAKQQIPRLAADTQAFTVVVRNEACETVYTATLTFAGLWMNTPIPTE